MTIPIIALSAINKNELKEKAEALDFSCYLSKPFDIDELKRIVALFEISDKICLIFFKLWK